MMKRPVKRRIRIQASVIVRNRSGRVVGRGKSKPNNLILNNFGEWLAALLRTPTKDAIVSTTLKGDDGLDNTVIIYTNSVTVNYRAYNYDGAVGGSGTQMKVGSGTTAAARGDTDIETAFATAPESGLFATGNGSYAAGTITVSGSITAGGNGTANEVGLYGFWYEETGDTPDAHMLFHDILTTGVSFTAGESITVSYTITL